MKWFVPAAHGTRNKLISVWSCKIHFKWSYSYQFGCCVFSICIFCGEKNPSFTEEGLDLHYWKNCPMLKRCANCKQVCYRSSLSLLVKIKGFSMLILQLALLPSSGKKSTLVTQLWVSWYSNSFIQVSFFAHVSINKVLIFQLICRLWSNILFPASWQQVKLIVAGRSDARPNFMKWEM